MKHIKSKTLPLILLLPSILISCCTLQEPAPALFKGEKFYGKRILEYKREYQLNKSYTDHSKKKDNRDINIINKNSNDVKTNMFINCKFLIPVKGAIISTIYPDEVCKDGIKIAAQGGTNVVASANGKIIYIGKGLRWYGNSIIMEHKDNYITIYSYLKSIYVKIGDQVKQGQLIGSAGKSCIQDKNPQICFTMRHNGQAVDPLINIMNCK